MTFPRTTAFLAALAFLGFAAGAEGQPVFRPVPIRGPAAMPPLPAPGPLSVQLVLDDNTADGSVGVIQGVGAAQFLWLNRFASPGAFDLEEIWVLFPADPGLAVGLSVELVVYHDPDSDPTNGASHLTSVATTIQAVDGLTFSIYPLGPAISVPAGGDVLIGVVNRFVTTGVTPPSSPATIDTTASQMRSWIGTYSGDPPTPPTLPPDGSFEIVDTFVPAAAGNWMIRGLGTRVVAPAVTEVPAATPLGLLALALLVAITASWRLRRDALR